MDGVCDLLTRLALDTGLHPPMTPYALIMPSPWVMDATPPMTPYDRTLDGGCDPPMTPYDLALDAGCDPP